MNYEDETYIDNIAIDVFSIAMKNKMRKKRLEGRGGWYDPTAISNEELSTMLKDHMEKGDPVDIANFCMMLFARGEKIK